MKKFFVLGRDISYSLSPVIFGKLFELFGDDAAYFIKDVKSLNSFEDLISDCEGFNVTKPYKREIVRLLSRDASGIGSVNTVTRDGVGYSTDGDGFLFDLERNFPGASSSNVLLIGYGGAALACAHALTARGANVAVTGRNASKVAQFAAERQVSVYDENFVPDGIVSCVTQTYVPELLEKPKFCYDLRYAGETLRLDCPCSDGKGMLIAQAIYAYCIFMRKRFDNDEVQSIYLKLKELL